jgi:hypothetical protein
MSMVEALMLAEGSTAGWGLKRQFPSALTQLAAVRISRVVAASTGIDASAVSTAADDPAIGVTSASVNHTAETTKSMLAKRFTILPPVRRMVARGLFVVGDFD